MAVPPQPHGIHPLAVRDGCRDLEWMAAYAHRRYGTVRMRARTCVTGACGRQVWELLYAGGQALIRRIERGDRVAVRETPPMPIGQARQTWEDLLYGRAR